MKCIYCNAEDELTSSDIITYAITGAKVTKSFVCTEKRCFSMTILMGIDMLFLTCGECL